METSHPLFDIKTLLFSAQITNAENFVIKRATRQLSYSNII